MGSCLSNLSSPRSPVSGFSPSPPLPSYVILNKVGMKVRGKMEVDWYKRGVLVEKMPTIDEEELPIS